MPTQQVDTDWFSSYGLFTAEAILARYNIQLSRTELIQTLKDPDSHHHYLVTMPVKNIFNGILLSQVHDCQLYAQKMVIDYKLSTNKTNEDEFQTQAEEALVAKQNTLLKLGELFEENKETHYQLLNKTHNWLITEAPKKTNLSDAPELSELGREAESVKAMFYDLRDEFRTVSVDLRTLLELVPNYTMDLDKLAAHQGEIDFNMDITL